MDRLLQSMDKQEWAVVAMVALVAAVVVVRIVRNVSAAKAQARKRAAERDLPPKRGRGAQASPDSRPVARRARPC